MFIVLLSISYLLNTTAAFTKAHSKGVYIGASFVSYCTAHDTFPIVNQDQCCCVRLGCIVSLKVLWTR